MKRIAEETIQQVLQATNIVDLVESYFPLKRVGGNFRANCPFHQEKTPSFYVSPSRQSFKCFGCGAGGTAIRFVMDYENISFQDTIKKLADRAGIALVEQQLDPKEEAKLKRRSQALTALRKTAEYYHELLLKSPNAQHARDYLKNRGLSRDTALNWMIGYAPASDREFFDWAREQGLRGRALVDAGIASLRDEHDPSRGLYTRFRDRLIFPIFNDYDDVVGYSGRLLDPESKMAKYLNSPETIVFNKSKLLFGLNKAKRPIGQAKHAILCEGQIDLIAASENGVQNIVAPLGTAFTPDHARMLRRYTETVVICYDGDAAGVKAAERSQKELADAGLVVRVARLPQGDDPDSFIQRDGVDAFRQLIDNAVDFYDYLLGHKVSEINMSDVGDRTRLARELAEKIGELSDKMLRETVVHKVSARLGVDDKLLMKEVATARSRSQNQERSRAAASEARGDIPHDAEPVAPKFSINSAVLELLCHIALSSEKGRKIIATSEWKREWLDDVEHGTILTEILDAEFDADNPSSVNAWLSHRPNEQEAYFFGVLDKPLPTEKLQDCVLDALERLRRQSIRTRLGVAKARLRDPSLPASDLLALQKEVLALQNRLKNTAPPEDAPSRTASPAPKAQEPAPDPANDDPF
ncbi:DNA primase [Sulfuriroseicoccus oceanibius]|uniref:DNA primase n=1 Tax=Sulfuriroseicoccus oceanibius TaxID=2707525 RepID=A0A6B3L403_9BACT|nr:DNA primase [Sulfuriroseicoccus oceanibius]QQL46213.1 DNA primase [Sulfuriroseicoccus oceanibius]